MIDIFQKSHLLGHGHVSDLVFHLSNLKGIPENELHGISELSREAYVKSLVTGDFLRSKLSTQNLEE